MVRPSQEETDALLKPPIADDSSCEACGLVTYPAAWCVCPPAKQMAPFLEFQILSLPPDDESYELARERAEAEYELLLK